LKIKFEFIKLKVPDSILSVL